MALTEDHEALRHLLAVYRGRLRKQLLLDIMNHHALHSETLREVGEYYGMDFSVGTAQMFILKAVAAGPGIPDARREALMGCAEQALMDALRDDASEAEACATADFLAILACFPDEARRNAGMRALRKRFAALSRAEAAGEHALVLSLGAPASDAEGLSRSFSTAIAALELAVTRGYGRVYDGSMLEVVPLDAAILQPVQIASLQSLLGVRDAGALSLWVDRTYDELSPILTERPVLVYRLPREILQRAYALVREQPGAAFLAPGQQFDLCVSSAQEKEAIKQALAGYCAGGSSRFSPGIAAVQACIALRFREQLTLEDLSELARMNPRYLSTLFHQETGRTISQQILDYRVAAARSLLTLTTDSIEEIAAAVGYQDARYFSRVFRRATGMTPTACRAAGKP